MTPKSLCATELYGLSSGSDAEDSSVRSDLRNDGVSDAEIWGPRIVMAVILIWGSSLIIGFQTALAILLMFGYVGALIGLSRPAIGLFGIGALCAMDPLARLFLLTGGILRWHTLNYWLILVTIIAMPAWLRMRGLSLRLLQAFFVLLLFEMVGTPAPLDGMTILLGVGAVLGLVVYFSRVGADYRVWHWLAWVTGVLGAGGGFVYYLQRDALPFANPNVFSRFPLTACFAICMAQSVARGRNGGIALWLLALTNSFWVVLSGSRGGMAVGFCCLLFLIADMPGIVRPVIAMLLAIIIMAFASVHYEGNLEFAQGRVRMLWDEDQSLSSRTSGRSELARGGWRIFLAHPLGQGTGSFASSWVELDDADISFRRGQRRAAHSGWVKVLAENGIPGIVILGGYVMSFALLGLKSGNLKLMLFGIFVSAVISAAWLSTQFHEKLTSFLAAGAIAIFAPKPSVVIQNPIPQRP